MGLLQSNDFNQILGTASQSAGTLVRSVAKSEREKRLQEWKSALGTGYKKNLFIVKFDFAEHGWNLYDSIINSSNIQKVKDYLKYNTSSGDQSAGVWVGLGTGFQFPGFKMTESDEVFRHRSYLLNTEKGIVTVDFVNDQWNINNNFWRNYYNLVCNGSQLLYPEDYMFNIEFITYTTQDEKFQKTTFYDCYATNLPDSDYSYDGTKDLDTFKIDFNWNDYKVETSTIVTKSTPSFLGWGTLYLKELLHILKIRAKYLGQEVVSRTLNELYSQEDVNDIIEKYFPK